MDKMFYISKVDNAYYVPDVSGHKVEIKNRFACALIVIRTGKIRFRFKNFTYEVERGNAILIPQGAEYINECIEDAKSYVFNFYVDDNFLFSPELLPAPPISIVQSCYDAFVKYHTTVSEQLYVVSKLYELLHQLFVADIRNILSESVNYMWLNYHNPSLSVEEVAKHSNFSAAYLFKLFKKLYGKTPHQYLISIRMEKAYEMIRLKYPIGVIARNVGYQDIYQFSRAYKKFYGFSPSDTPKSAAVNH